MPATREEISKQIGGKIREIRITKGLTIEKLALDANIDYSQLSRIERGKINTSIYKLHCICICLDVPLVKLLEDIR